MHFSYEASTGHFNIGEGVETSVEVKIRKTENLKTCSLFGDKRYLFFSMWHLNRFLSIGFGIVL